MLSWYQFRQWLERFGKKMGKLTIAVPPHYTSQICSDCGAIVKKSLSTRTHKCACGCELDRDFNAAINILRRGISTVGHTGTWVEDLNAWGEGTATQVGEILSGQVRSRNQESPCLQTGECQNIMYTIRWLRKGVYPQFLLKTMMIEQKKPRYTIHNGFRMPMGYPPEAFSSGLSYQPQPGDIFIAAYPKCGTTWVQYIVWLIIHDGEPLPPGKRLREAIPMLEAFGKEFVAALPTPRAIKTHLPYQMTPYHPETKYIHVSRNPFDCVVSFYHHTKGFIEDYDFANGSFDEYFECFIAGEVDFGDYFDNVLSWYEHRNAPNILCLTYENLKDNPQEAVSQIAGFLGSEYVDKVNNEQILNKILTNSSFASMSQDQNRWAIPRPDNTPFIRKGQIGDWRNYFSDDQTKRLTEKFLQRTKGTGLEKLWSNLIPSLATEEATN